MVKNDEFRQNLTQSTGTKSDQAGFAQYDQGCLWKNASESKSGKLVAGWLPSA